MPRKNVILGVYLLPKDIMEMKSILLLLLLLLNIRILTIVEDFELDFTFSATNHYRISLTMGMLDARKWMSGLQIQLGDDNLSSIAKTSSPRIPKHSVSPINLWRIPSQEFIILYLTCTG
jgi:hypothetical protein